MSSFPEIPSLAVCRCSDDTELEQDLVICRIRSGGQATEISVISFVSQVVGSISTFPPRPLHRLDTLEAKKSHPSELVE